MWAREATGPSHISRRGRGSRGGHRKGQGWGQDSDSQQSLDLAVGLPKVQDLIGCGGESRTAARSFSETI